MIDQHDAFPIVDSLWLQTQLGQPGLKILDVRPVADYLQAHLPGAQHFDIEQINVRKPPVSGLLPETADLNRVLSVAGLNNGDRVIVYDAAGGPAAARLVWSLRAFGHDAAAMLDAGFDGWLATGGRTVTAIPGIAPTSYQARLDPGRIADRDYIQNRLGQSNLVIVDARSLAEFEGADLRASRGGHIPGAVHFDWNYTKAPDGHFKSADQLRPQLESLGITPDKEVICYCQSHQRSSVLCLLLEALGYPDVKGYPGAWSDWANAPATPVKSEIACK